MHKKLKMLTWITVILLTVSLSACSSKINAVKATSSNFQTPIVTLSYVDVAHYWGWWYFSKKVKPTTGTQGDYGAPLDLAFVFDVENPNSFPVKMESLKFTVAFEEFDLNTVSSTESQWIPPGKTNQVRVHAMFDGRQSLLSLLVTGGFKLKEKGMGTGAGAALKQLAQWWKTIPKFEFPVSVKDGAAVFTAADSDITKVESFNAVFP